MDETKGCVWMLLIFMGIPALVEIVRLLTHVK